MTGWINGRASEVHEPLHCLPERELRLRCAKAHRVEGPPFPSRIPGCEITPHKRFVGQQGCFDSLSFRERKLNFAQHDNVVFLTKWGSIDRQQRLQLKIYAAGSSGRRTLKPEQAHLFHLLSAESLPFRSR